MSKALDSQRTYALIGTGGCGKTSLAEMLLFQSGVINRLGAIEEGTTTLDYEPEEIKRRGSIQPGFATFLWNKDRHFLMDVPGDTNFTGDLPYLLMGVDAAVLVIDAVDGVRPLTRRIWNAVREAGLPSFVFINKMDRDRADFDMAFNGLSSVLGMKPVTLYMPVMTDGVFTGVVDILGGKALMFGENGAVTEALIPDAIADEAALLHDTTVENIAESDEELMEKTSPPACARACSTPALSRSWWAPRSKTRAGANCSTPSPASSPRRSNVRPSSTPTATNAPPAMKARLAASSSRPLRTRSPASSTWCA